jgi:hypothetical protein
MFEFFLKIIEEKKGVNTADTAAASVSVSTRYKPIQINYKFVDYQVLYITEELVKYSFK